MKGKLTKNKEGKWSVKYKHYTDADACPVITCELLLHPDTFSDFNNKRNAAEFYPTENKEVEFEIVEDFKENKLWGQKGTGVYTKYAKLIIPKKGSFDEEAYGVTRVIDDKQKVSEEAKRRTKNLYTPSHKKYIEPKQEKSNETWDEIFHKHWKEKDALTHITEFQNWLKEHYSPPKKLKK